MCLFHCVIATEIDYRIQYNRFRVVLHAVDSLNVKHELRSKKIKQFRGSVSSVGRALSTAEREVAGSIPGAGPILRVLK